MPIPWLPGKPDCSHARRRSSGGTNRSTSTPCGTTAATCGTSWAAVAVVAITASMREISARGMNECRRLAADVKTSRIGSRKMSRPNSPANISMLRRTCQMAKGRFAGGRRQRRRAVHSEIDFGASGSGLPTSCSGRCFRCCETTPLAVADTPVKRRWKLVTNNSAGELVVAGLSFTANPFHGCCSTDSCADAAVTKDRTSIPTLFEFQHA